MTASTPLAVSVSNVSHSYGTTRILRDVCFSLERGQVLALLGPSGCGKTTLLRMISGLEAPDEGNISILGKSVSSSTDHTFLPPEKRGLGLVFQDYALWPHMSVFNNVSFPLEMLKVGRSEREDRVRRALDRVGLAGMGDRQPSELSGGQQQRVAIARAIVAEPPLVLFDEPLSNLDRELRETMVGELGDLVASLGLTAVYVTHDHAEAFALAHQTAIMRKGEIVQMSPPEQLVANPIEPYIADFLRLGCLLPVTPSNGSWVIDGTSVAFPAPPEKTVGTKATVLVPGHSAKLTTPGETAAGAVSLACEVRRSQFRGTYFETAVRLTATPYDVQVASPIRLAPGSPAALTFSPADLHWFATA